MSIARYIPTLSKGVYGLPWEHDPRPGLSDIIKWKRSAPKVVVDKQELDQKLPVVPMNWSMIRNPRSDALVCTWIGHATMLVQMDGKNILTDPIFSERCAPVQFIGPSRIRPTPCEVKDLPPIDMVLVSHNHYDHLDYHTVMALGNTPQWFVPLGMKKWFEGIGVTNVVELNWWEERVSNSGLKVVSTPCQHWSKRTAFDDNKALWCSFAVMGSKRFYFSGDTAYCPAFKQTGDELGPFDLACIPIGAYCPRWFMKGQHVDPEEAVKIHLDIKAKKSVGMHWGTFVLTDEPIMEPPQKLNEAKKALGLADEDFVAFNIGETREF